MRIFLLLVFLCFNFTTINSQQLSIEAGKTISSFDFENSQGESLDNLQSSNHTYLSFGYRKNVFTEAMFLNINLNYNEYGSIGSDMALDNFFEWDLSYLGISAGFDYEFYKPGSFTFFIKASAGAELLIQGTQTLNNQVFNLSDEEDFNSAIYGFRGGLGVQYKMSPSLSLFTQYLYGTNGRFKDVQGNLKIKTHNVGLGLLINLTKGQEIASSVDNEQMEALKKELDANSQKLKALEESTKNFEDIEKRLETKEKEIAAKNLEIKRIKTTISDALSPYKGDDLAIKERDGKVYVTMINHLIFNSGSSKISSEGEKALENLGTVLAENRDLNVLIEGHTDNLPYNSSTMSNWDLSVKRATAIVESLAKNKNINLKNLVVSGRGEFDPIADNTTADGRSKNRRIEIIISPNLKDLLKLTKH
ncbi:OmpA family protein [Olleya sp. AH-315-F22]|nr:OmpA family protein [Olleya sp. AH-315-F22]